MSRKDTTDEVSVYDLDALRAAFRQSIRDNGGEASGWSNQAEQFLNGVAKEVLREAPRNPPRPSRRRGDPQPQMTSWNNVAAWLQSVLKSLPNRRQAERDPIGRSPTKTDR